MAGLSRRKFLIATGWIAGGATVLYTLRNKAISVAPTIIFHAKEYPSLRSEIQRDNYTVAFPGRWADPALC